MKKKYFVILNSIIVAKESSLADAVILANKIRISFKAGIDTEAINYQTVYTNIKKVGYYFKQVPVKYLEDMPEANMYLTIQEIDI
jgi:hypothetical protein